MDTTQRAEFISHYARTVLAAWHEPDFNSRLNSHPAATLAAQGLTTKPNAKFNIVHQVSGHGDIDIQVNAWERGDTTGEYTLYIPSSEAAVQGIHLDAADEAAFRADTQGGVAADATSVTLCCCCTPCCC